MIILINNFKSTHYSFPPMDKIQRQIIHELSKYYNLDSQSCNIDELKKVVITKRKDSKM